MSSVSTSDLSKANGVFELARQNLDHFAAEVCARAFDGEHMFEVEAGELVQHIEATLSDLRPDHDLPRTAKEYFDMWKQRPNGPAPWFRTTLDENGIERVHMTDAAKMYLQVIERSTIEASTTTVEKLQDFLTYTQENAARITGRVQDQKDILQSQIDRLQEEIEHLDRMGVGDIADTELEKVASKLREYVLDIRAGVSAAPVAARKRNKDINETLYAPDTLDASPADLHIEALGIHEEFATGHPFKIMMELSSLYNMDGRRKEISKDIRELVEGLGDHLSDYDRERIQGFFGHVVDIGADIVTEHSKTSAQLHSFLNDPEIGERKREAVEFRQTKAVCKQIGQLLKPTPQDKRLRGIGLEFPDRSAGTPPAAITRTLSKRNKPSTGEKRTVEPSECDVEEIDRTFRETMGEANRRVEVLASKTFEANVKAMLASDGEFRVKDYFDRHPLTFGLTEFEAFFNYAVTMHPSEFDIPDIAAIPLTPDATPFFMHVPNFRIIHEGEPAMSYDAAARMLFEMQMEATERACTQQTDQHDDDFIDLNSEDFNIAAE